MNIERRAPSSDELSAVYQDAGWIENPQPEKMLRAVESGSEWFVVRGEDASLRGLGRIITDYARYAFIVDVIVLEKYQKIGIGTAIMHDILKACRGYGVDSVHLWPSKGKVAFYEKFGFNALPPEQPHMKLGLA